MPHSMNFLFPTPSPPPSSQSPYRWPGITPQSTSSLIKVLEDNHKSWHILFGERLHNHSAHRALALWNLGVDGTTIEAGYHCNLRPKQRSIQSPGPISESNFEEHLGDDSYYQSYINFFTDYVHQNGMQDTLKTFVFSRRYNFDIKKPQMFSRFMAGLLHPMIHVGFGTEFGLPGLMVEGLAQAAIHDPEVFELISPESFLDPGSTDNATISENISSSVVSTATRRIEQIAAGLYPSPNGVHETQPNLRGPIYSNQDTGNVHALTILARVMADSRLDHPDDVREHTLIQKTLKKHASLIRHYTSQWSINMNRSDEIDNKVQELVWMNSVTYGVAGWTWAQKVKGRSEGEFNADLFLLHFVTSSLFLPSLLAYLRHSPHLQVVLLRSYLGVCLAWYVARGRPALDIRGFYASPLTALEDQDTPQAWLPLVERVIPHPDEHLPKLILTLANYSSRFGATPAGTFSGPREVNAAHEEQQSISPVVLRPNEGIATELPGAEYLDGTLFIRIARLTLTRLERVGQGEVSGTSWDRKGFYDHLPAPTRTMLRG